MAINTYSELKTEIADFMDRTDLTDAKLETIISLAEATFNRELKMVETDVTLTGTISSRAIDISSYDIIEPVALFLAESGEDEYALVPRSDGYFPYLDSEGKPTIWAIDGDYINFDRPLDQAYPFRFRYRGKFALSDVVTTNQLLTDHPDVYLAGCIVWGGLYVQDNGRVQAFASLLENFMRSTKHKLAINRRGNLLVDSALISGPSYGYQG